MLIRYTGPSVIRRTVGPYVWEKANGHVQDVSADMAADLLTSPEGCFEVDRQEPLLEAAPVSVDDAVMAGLAIAGLESVEQFAAMSEDDLLHVGLSAGLAPAFIVAWADIARDSLSVGEFAHDLLSSDEEE